MSSLIHQNSSQSPSSLSTITQGNDGAEPGSELKTEFYTREGLWRLVPNGEYIRQPQSIYAQQQNIQNSTNAQQMNANCNGMQISSSESVRIACFKYFKFDEVLSSRNFNLMKNLCIKCAQKKILKNSKKQFGKKKILENSRVHLDSMHDDDDDIIYDEHEISSDEDDQENPKQPVEFHLTQSNLSRTASNSDSNNKSSTTSQHSCKYCSSKINRTNDSNLLIANYNANNILELSPYLDLTIFNYAREIYFYESNDIKTKITNDMKNLVDKKAYRTFMSTCFDQNVTASMLNTLELQNKNNDSKNNATAIREDSLNTVSTSVNLSPNNLSLIIAAGFNKGEIHVFDGFKKEASVFYNNNRLIEKSKVTCIKWLPNSMNLFLVGHASGCIYLYDATNQTQPNVPPTFTKFYQDESFSIFLNPHASSAANTNIIADKIDDVNLNKTPKNSKSFMNTSQSSPSSLQTTPSKLVLSSSNQTPSAVAKNPLLKWSIGSAENSSSEGHNIFTNINSAGVNGVNEMAFSPCGSYLAVVSQDGYLRIFAFAYHNNQQMQIQLLGSMKSYFGGLLCCCWSLDGRYIATGGEDDFVTLFSFSEMRVACRGRGHNSWINICTFDDWTCLTENFDNKSRNRPRKKSNNRSSSINPEWDIAENEQHDDSDLEEFHTTKALKKMNLNQQDLIKPTAASSPHVSVIKSSQIMTKRNPITKKNRTISTLSDFNYSNLDYNLGGSVYYRLASVGQDNQICFWDLTEDVLKEKTNHGRSRLTSMNTPQQPKQHSELPQIIIQPTELQPNAESAKTMGANSQQKSSHSSLVSTARNLFSLKHSDLTKSKSSKSKTAFDENDDHSHKSSSSSSSSSSFFKKHKRNSSLNNSLSHGDKTKASQITLNSYTKKSGTNTINSISEGINSHNHTQHVYNRSMTESGVSLMEKNQKNDHDNLNGKSRALSNNACCFNICPKLHEVPIIEPLICKRIAKERLTDIKFKEDCFITATQDGYVYTWARPELAIKDF